MIEFGDTNALIAEVNRLTRENTELRKELWNQWEYNHAEHCTPETRGILEPIHQLVCNWPIPEVLMTKASAPKEVS